METSSDSTRRSPPKVRLNSIAFLVGVLFFLLPFVNIKCRQNYISNNGVGLALGINYQTSKQIEAGKEKSKKISFTEEDPGKIYAPALIALLFGLAGLILSIMNSKFNKINGIFGMLAVLALIALMIQIKNDLRNGAFDRNLINGINSNLKLSVEFTAWYYLSLLSFISAAFFSYWQKPIVFSG